MSRRRVGRLAGLAVLLAWGLARGHQSSLAYSDIVVDGVDVAYTIQIASTDLYEAVGIERDRPVSRDEVRAGQQRLFEYLGARLHIEEHGAPCPSQPDGLEFIDKADGFFVAAHLAFHCPRPIADGRVRYDLFFDLDPRHQGLARIAFGDAEGREQVFRDGARTLELRRQLTVLDHARQYLRLGIEHIFTGYDHIAFLFGLLAIAGAHGLRAGARAILGVVTAFTIAHSVTLIASALGSSLLSPIPVMTAVAAVLVMQQLTPPSAAAAAPRWPVLRLAVAATLAFAAAALATRALPWLAADAARLIEAAIALSIVYVGLENLVRPAPSHRFLLTFGFGLVHGFGFASVLREIGLPDKGLLLSLLSFNLGVEIGQLGVVAAVLPLLAVIASPTSLALGLAVLTAASLGAFAVLSRFGVPLPTLGVMTFGAAPLLFVLGRRLGYDRLVRRGGSTVIAALAAFWFLERALGRSWLGGWLG